MLGWWGNFHIMFLPVFIVSETGLIKTPPPTQPSKHNHYDRIRDVKLETSLETLCDGVPGMVLLCENLDPPFRHNHYDRIRVVKLKLC